MANYETEYAILSTFERSWICKLGTDESGKLNGALEISCPYFTSIAARKKTMNDKNLSDDDKQLIKETQFFTFFEVAFLLFAD